MTTSTPEFMGWGHLLVYKPEDGHRPVVYRLMSGPPDHIRIHGLVGGFFKDIPDFDTIDFHGYLHECAAFCNDRGKLDNLQANLWATLMWNMARRRRGDYAPNCNYLAGPVVIVIPANEKKFNLSRQS